MDIGHLVIYRIPISFPYGVRSHLLHIAEAIGIRVNKPHIYIHKKFVTSVSSLTELVLIKDFIYYFPYFQFIHFSSATIFSSLSDYLNTSYYQILSFLMNVISVSVFLEPLTQFLLWNIDSSLYYSYHN